METLARSCGDGHWINAVAGIGIALGIAVGCTGVSWLIIRWVRH